MLPVRVSGLMKTKFNQVEVLFAFALIPDQKKIATNRPQLFSNQDYTSRIRYTSSVSVVTVLVPPPTSVTVVRDEEPRPPLNNATSNKITIAPPTIQTQGAAYHSVCSVVVVVTVLEDPLSGLSCPQLITWIKQSMNMAIIDFHVTDKLFIIFLFS
jgi:hypothetical protein